MSFSTASSLRPTLFKLTACFVYDALVVIALSFLLGWLFIVTLGDATQGIKRYALQMFLWLTIGLYFVWCWSRSGQTLAMHTWRLKLVKASSSAPLNIQTAAIRYLLATISLLLLGLGFFWALFDRDRCYLHDRLLKANIISLPKQ
jgi:uncharacterized RDD family membrane protein YckC